MSYINNLFVQMADEVLEYFAYFVKDIPLLLLTAALIVSAIIIMEKKNKFPVIRLSIIFIVWAGSMYFYDLKFPGALMAYTGFLLFIVTFVVAIYLAMRLIKRSKSGFPLVRLFLIVVGFIILKLLYDIIFFNNKHFMP